MAPFVGGIGMVRIPLRRVLTIRVGADLMRGPTYRPWDGLVDRGLVFPDFG